MGTAASTKRKNRNSGLGSSSKPAGVIAPSAAGAASSISCSPALTAEENRTVYGSAGDGHLGAKAEALFGAPADGHRVVDDSESDAHPSPMAGDPRKGTISHLLQAESSLVDSTEDLRCTASQSFGLSPYDTRAQWVRTGSLSKVVAPPPHHRQQKQQRDDSPLTKGQQQPQSGSLPVPFVAACTASFATLDTEHSGRLPLDQVWEVLGSDALGLQLSHEELSQVQQMSRLVSKDADDTAEATEVQYNSFLKQVAAFLRRVYRRKETDWNDWARVHNVETGENVFYNKRSSITTKEQPKAFNEERIDDPLLEFVFLRDGRELTTARTEAGARLYVDWDSMEWKEFPSEWEEQIWNPSMMASDDEERWQEFVHPKLGLVKTYALENTRNSHVYFQESTGTWERLPLLWEVHVPMVQTMLKEISRLIPQWKNVKEQLLVLRECNYDLREVISFAEVNFPSASHVHPADEQEADSVLTMEMVKRQTQLDKQLTAAKEEVEELKAALAHHRKTSDHKLTRRMTEMNITLGRAERTTHATQTQLESLRKQVREQQEEIVTLVGKLEKTEARQIRHSTAFIKEESVVDDPAIVQEAAVGNAEFEAALQAAQTAAEEKAALAIRVAELEQKLKNPVPGAATRDAIKLLSQQVRGLKESHEKTAVELRDDTAQLTEQFISALRVARTLNKDIAAQLEELRGRYRKEHLQRKLLFNKVQELRGNIRVFVRCRHDASVKTPVLDFPSETEVLATNLAGEKILMDYDQVFTPQVDTPAVFEHVKNTVTSVLDGYNVCLMAYGQTGSGKTHTILGTPENPGINRLALKQLTTLQAEKTECTFGMEISVVEIYNEKVFDLLQGKKTYNNPLEVHVGAAGTYIRDLEQRKVTTVEELEDIMDKFSAVRITAATAMNFTSSRSHLIVQVKVTSFNRLSKATTKGKLTFVDLAGSERVARSHAEGQRLIEAAAINKSLSGLGLVFKSLAQKSGHVPYRNTKLTQILQDSLGGNSKTMMVVTVSPDEAHLSESLSSLHFGMGIRKVHLGTATANKKFRNLPHQGKPVV